MDKEKLDWIEKNALENLRSRINTADILAKEAQVTLTVLLAGIGAALGYAFKDGSIASNISRSMLILSGYLMIIAGIVVFTCMMVVEIPMVTNEPQNLNGEKTKNLSLEEIRGYELENIQKRIDETRNRNDVTAKWLNRARALTVFSPVVFLLILHFLY